LVALLCLVNDSYEVPISIQEVARHQNLSKNYLE